MERKDFLAELGDAYRDAKPAFWVLFFVLTIFSLAVFSGIPKEEPAAYFLDVGQGDSQMVRFPHGGVMLVDAGRPNGLALREIGKTLPFYKRSVEMAFVTHPDLDHFGGFPEIFRRYRTHVLFTNGDESSSPAYLELKRIAEEKNIPLVVLEKGDRVLYDGSEIQVLWPLGGTPEKEGGRNERSLVFTLSTNNVRILYTGDAPTESEEEFSSSLRPVDILKVGHHGSKYSTGEKILLATAPRIAVIGVGKNSYGHPAPEVLKRLENFGARIFRTDMEGTIKIPLLPGELRVLRVK